MEKSIWFVNIIDNLGQIKSKAEIKELHSILRERYKQVKMKESIDIKFSLRKGDSVKIKEENIRGKADRLYNKVGIVEKLNPSKAVVKFEGRGWRIPYSMLTLAV